MSETELEKIKVRTAEHFENDKNNIPWLKEGKSSSSGLCFYCIKNGAFAYSQKMALAGLGERQTPTVQMSPAFELSVVIHMWPKLENKDLRCWNSVVFGLQQTDVMIFERLNMIYRH